MKPDDRNLGMGRAISRRDFLLGMGALAASIFVPGRAFADERYLFVRGRKPFGRIAIVNSDAGSTSMLDVAIDQAHRAVHELG